MKFRRMRHRLALLGAIALLTASCMDNGTGVDADLTGEWVGALPASGELRLVLRHNGMDVGGVGFIRDASGARSMLLSGAWVDAELDLTLSFEDHCEAGFTGRLRTPNQLEGRFMDCNTQFNLSLMRDPN